LALSKKKNDVRVIFLGEGSTCRFNLNTNKERLSKAIAQRKKFCLKALKTLKVKSYFFYDLPCGKFDQIPMLSLAKIVEKEINPKLWLERRCRRAIRVVSWFTTSTRFVPRKRIGWMEFISP
jgi:hypothetical protein